MMQDLKVLQMFLGCSARPDNVLYKADKYDRCFGGMLSAAASGYSQLCSDSIALLTPQTQF